MINEELREVRRQVEGVARLLEKRGRRGWAVLVRKYGIAVTFDLLGQGVFVPQERR